MRSKYALCAAVALTVSSTAAFARDGAPYVGIEGGVIKGEKLKLDFRSGTIVADNALVLEHETGFDADLIAGYDFGFIRAEGELGWKRVGVEDIAIASQAIIPTTGRPAANGNLRALSAMGNLLLDFGIAEALQIYAGGGVGVARVSLNTTITGPGVPAGRLIDADDRSLAWQLIGGMRVPLNDNVDLGVKYRYFRSKVDFDDTSLASRPERLNGRLKTHSVLASLIVNFGRQPVSAPPPPPPPPPAPPPAPPATQICPDGSVILATDVCPVPPPPPPPPPAAPERG